MVEKQTVLQQRNFDEHECAIDQQATDTRTSITIITLRPVSIVMLIFLP